MRATWNVRLFETVLSQPTRLGRFACLVRPEDLRRNEGELWLLGEGGQPCSNKDGRKQVGGGGETCKAKIVCDRSRALSGGRHVVESIRFWPSASGGPGNTYLNMSHLLSPFRRLNSPERNRKCAPSCASQRQRYASFYVYRP